MAAAGHDDVVSPRRQLPHISSLEDVVAALAKAKKVVVLAGAGISVSCGIPDFRSKDGIYDMVQEMDLGLDDDPQCLFDLEFFTDDPEPFYRFAHKLYPKGVQPSATHHFLARLEAEGKLRRVYTQNIDGLEAAAGVSGSHLVCAHGSLGTVTCSLKGGCRKTFPADVIRADVDAGRVATCPHCREGGDGGGGGGKDKGEGSKKKKKKRKGGKECVLKPDVTFFGEAIKPAVKRAIESDRLKADLLIVLGTSLQVRALD
jgi:NAD-dependent deacetylase sirtuin 1